jgi:hypothetical protein
LERLAMQLNTWKVSCRNRLGLYFHNNNNNNNNSNCQRILLNVLTEVS